MEAGADNLASRVEKVLLGLKRFEHAVCPLCRRALCGHDTLFSMVLGHQDVPRCVTCLSASLGRDRELLRDEVTAYVLSKECLTVGWAWANLREGHSASTSPACLRWVGRAASSATPGRETMDPSEKPDAEWDAGDLGCGDLVLELRTRMGVLSPGQVLRLVARDPGAPEDLPAWCNMTGHRLLKAVHPEYLIVRRAG